MKKLLAMAVVLSATLFLTSCSEDGGISGPSEAELQQTAFNTVIDAVTEKVTTDAAAAGFSKDNVNFGWTLSNSSASAPASLPKVVVEGNIAANTTWTADNIYVITKRVTVLDGVTLTIEPGTRIEGDSQFEGVDASVLMIARGAKIMAMGTVANPIIMTSDSDDGSLTSINKGEWGGLVILGKAPISAEATETQIEGVPADDINGLYGGTEAADNSGVLQYISIRHGGAVIDASAGDEINGLTLGGVGAGTTIDHVEVFANSDDGIELFGGTVDLSYLFVNRVGDDAIDIDQSYAGTINYFVVIVDQDSDEGLEVDGREGEMIDTFTITNGTIEAAEGASITCDFKSKARGSVTNLNANGGKIKLSASFDGLTPTEDAAKNVIDDNLTFTTVNATFEVYTSDLTLLGQ